MLVFSVQGYLHVLLGDPLGPSDPLGRDPTGNNLYGVRHDPRVALKSSYKYFPYAGYIVQTIKVKSNIPLPSVAPQILG